MHFYNQCQLSTTIIILTSIPEHFLCKNLNSSLATQQSTVKETLRKTTRQDGHLHES